MKFLRSSLISAAIFIRNALLHDAQHKFCLMQNASKPLSLFVIDITYEVPFVFIFCLVKTLIVCLGVLNTENLLSFMLLSQKEFMDYDQAVTKHHW